MTWWQLALAGWQLALAGWLCFGPLVLLVMAVIDWWSRHSLDREWKQFNRSIKGVKSNGS